MNKGSYLNELDGNSSKVHSNYLSVPSTTTEVSLIKKFLLESTKKSNDFRIKTSPQKIKSNTERVFVKSPTPMREIFLNDDDKKQQEHIYDEENAYDLREKINPRSRNRFSKIKPSLRSQSVDISRVNDYNSLESTANKPNLTRQDAFGNTFTKSLAENIDNLSRHKSAEVNDIKQRRNYRNYSKSRKSKNYNTIDHRNSHYRSSSLTDSSSESITQSLSSSSSSSIDSIILREKIHKENNTPEKNYIKSILIKENQLLI